MSLHPAHAAQNRQQALARAGMRCLDDAKSNRAQVKRLAKVPNSADLRRKLLMDAVNNEKAAKAIDGLIEMLIYLGE